MFTLEEIKKAVGKRPCREDASVKITGVSINSRTLKKGNVFIAIKGEKFDGHDFIKEALKKGAAVIVSNPNKHRVFVWVKDENPNKHPVFVWVKDTTKALGQIAAWHRRRFNVPVIAVTGSTGKTTTKDMIAAILKTKYKVLKNFKTENNHYGVPLTLLQLNASYQMVVLEFGTNQKGDIEWIGKIACPTIVVFTNVGHSHLQGLKTPSGVFCEKFQLVKHMALNGHIIFNKDDYYLKAIEMKKISQRKISYAVVSKADYQINEIVDRNNKSISFKFKRKIFSLKTPVEHNIYNALAAVCCGVINKINYNNIVKSLSMFKFSGGRQEIKRVGKFWVIDDTYNANPVSFMSAIQTLENFQTKGQRIAVCADMAELGEQSRDLHQEVGEKIAEANIDVVMTLGEDARFIAQAVKKFNKHIKTFHCTQIHTIYRNLQKILKPKDIVLVKGSRCMRMERVVEYIVGTGSKPDQ